MNELVHKIPFEGYPFFSFVSVFGERTAYRRRYCLPFNMISVCADEDANEPSEVLLTERNEHFLFHKNDVALTTCDTPAEYYYRSRKNLHYCIHFRCELYPGLDLMSGIRRRFVMNSPELASELCSLFREKDRLKMLAGCEMFALKILRMHWPDKLPFDERRLAPYSPVFAFVRDHADASLGVPELASVCGMAESSFAHGFSSAVGMSPKLFLRKELLKKAFFLLSDPSLNIREISEKLAFSNEFNFSRFFKRECGFSPSGYRKRICRK